MYIDNLSDIIIDVFDYTPDVDETNLSHLINDRVHLVSGMMNEDIWIHEGVEDPYTLRHQLP